MLYKMSCVHATFDLSQVFATLNGLLTRQPFAIGGSGSSYVYGFVDAEYRKGMSKEESQQFVVNSESLLFIVLTVSVHDSGLTVSLV